MLRDPQLDRLVGRAVYLQAENLQKTGAFKVRGALSALTAATGSEAHRPVVTASAGNFGQGVAWGATELGRSALVFVPESTPEIKRQRIVRFGAEVRVLGEDFDQTNTLARRFAELEGGVFLPPFDHARVIEGQGTAVRELLLAVPQIDALVLPCGGGGLVAGAVLAARELGRDVRIVAVEPVGLPSLGRALTHGRPIKLDAGHTLADGIAVREVGRLPLRVMRRHLAGVVTVTEPQLLHAIRFLALETKQIVEGAGAAATAALLSHSSGLETLLGDRRNVGVLLSGGNLDPALLCQALGNTAEAA